MIKEIVKEVPVEVRKDVLVPVEVIKQVEVVKEVPVIKEVVREVPVEKVSATAGPAPTRVPAPSCVPAAECSRRGGQVVVKESMRLVEVPVDVERVRPAAPRIQCPRAPAPVSLRLLHEFPFLSSGACAR